MPTSQAAATGSVRAVLEPILLAAGIDLEDVTVTVAGRRRLVRVIVDRDGGLDLDDVSDASGLVSTALDETDALGNLPYVLEVSSPGVDRPLREPRHWRRAAGRLVRVRVAGEGALTVRIISADEEGVLVRPPDAAASPADGPDERRLPYSALGPGAVQVEFSRPDAGDAADGEEDNDGPDGSGAGGPAAGS